MVLLPKVKLKTVPTFPSNIIGGTGLTSTKENGKVVLDYAWQEFGTIDAIPTQATAMILTYDTATNAYVMVPSHLLGGSVAGIADTPADGVLYGRKNPGGWTTIAGGTPANTLPLMDGTAAIGTSLLYARQDHRHPTDTTRLGDATSDGTLYGRKNGTWTPVPASTPGIPDAPNDGVQYARQSVLGTMSWTTTTASTSYVPIYNTRNLAIAATVPVGTTYLRINGYTAAGDGGAFDVAEVANTGAVSAWQFQTNGGTRRWKISNTVINPRMFGGIGNGTNDDTAALQACIDMTAQAAYVSIFIPSVPAGSAWRVTAPLNITSSLAIHGDGMPGTYNSTAGGLATFTRQSGSWILFDHLGVGFNINGGAGLSEVVFDGIGTLRNQPTPPASGGTFIPIGANYDFYCNETDVMILNSMLLNPTKGVYFQSSGGRLTMTNVRGQPLTEGINIYYAFDCCRLTDIHWWIYWSGAPAVENYTVNNRRGLRTARADGLLVMNYFSIFDFIAHDIYAASTSVPGITAGSTSLIRAKLVNCYFDGNTCGIAVDAAATGVIVEYTNLLLAYEPTIGANAHQFIVSCNNAEIYVTNFEISWAGAAGVTVLGTGNRVALHNPRIHGWDQFHGGSGGWPAIYCDNGNYIKLTGDIQVNQPTAGRSTTVKGGSGPWGITGQLASGYIVAAATDGAGHVTVAHGARATPSHGTASCYGGVTGFVGIICLLSSVDPTNVVYQFTNNVGALATPGNATFHWEVYI